MGLLGVARRRLPAAAVVWIVCVGAVMPGCQSAVSDRELMRGYCWRELSLKGLDRDDVAQQLGKPSEVLTEGFLAPTNTDGGGFLIPENRDPGPSGRDLRIKFPPSGTDEQWFYMDKPLEHIHVYFRKGRVAIAIHEWSDW